MLEVIRTFKVLPTHGVELVEELHEVFLELEDDLLALAEGRSHRVSLTCTHNFRYLYFT